MSSFAALMALSAFTFSCVPTPRPASCCAPGSAADMACRDAAPSRLSCNLTSTVDIGTESDKLYAPLRRTRSRPGTTGIPRRMTFVVVERRCRAYRGGGSAAQALRRAEQLVQLASLREHRRVKTSTAAGRVDDIVAEAFGSADATEPDERVPAGQVQQRTRRAGQAPRASWSTSTGTRRRRAPSPGTRSVGGRDEALRPAATATLRGRRSWRYAPSEELLTALLLAVFVRPDRGEQPPATMPLREVLDALRDQVRHPHRPAARIPRRCGGPRRCRSEPGGVQARGCSCSAASTACPTTSRCRSSVTRSETHDARRLARPALPRQVVDRLAAQLASRCAATARATACASTASVLGRVTSSSGALRTGCQQRRRTCTCSSNGRGGRRRAIHPAERAVEMRNRKERLLGCSCRSGRVGRELAGQQLRAPSTSQTCCVTAGSPGPRRARGPSCVSAVTRVGRELGRSRPVEAWARYVAAVVADPAGKPSVQRYGWSGSCPISAELDLLGPTRPQRDCVRAISRPVRARSPRSADRLPRPG